MNPPSPGTGVDGPVAFITRGQAEMGRWGRAETAGAPDPAAHGGVVERPSSRWGLAARGARVEPGSPAFDFTLDRKDAVWADEAAALYAQAVAAQWDPATAIDWSAPITHPAEIEDAVVQVMTYLIENEMAALIIPASFLARIHPHVREVLQVLAIQAADEARHVEVSPMSPACARASRRRWRDGTMPSGTRPGSMKKFSTRSSCWRRDRGSPPT